MKHNNKITIPNILTILRLVMVIPFLIFMFLAYIYIKKDYLNLSYDYDIKGRIFLAISLSIFMLAMITDFFDGYLARKYHQVTEFGKLWDPLADKIMITSSMIVLSIFGVIPVWIILTFILRDLIIDGARVVMAKNNISVAAKWTGKAKTMMQSIGIIILFIIFIFFDISNQEFLINHIPSTLKNKIDNKLTIILFIHLINLPMIIAAILNIVSGIEYFISIKPYIKLKPDNE